MKEELIAGIDLGGSKITCLVAKRPIPSENSENAKAPAYPGDSETLELIGDATTETTSLNNGLIVDLESMASAMKTVVAEAEKKAGVKLNELFIGIGGTHIKGEKVRGVIPISGVEKEITSKAVNEVIDQAKAIKSSPGRQIIYSIPQRFIIDEQSGIRNPIGMTGNRLEAEIYIVSGSSMGVQNVYKSAERAKVGVREIVLQSIANFYAVLEPGDRALGHILIDIGEETTEVGIFSDGKVKEIFSLDIGGSYITSDIAIGLGISKREAEELKIKYGIARSEMTPNEIISLGGSSKILGAPFPTSTGSAGLKSYLDNKQTGSPKQEKTIERKVLVGIIAPRVEEIFSSINRRIKTISENNYQAGNEDLDFMPSGIIIMGGTAKMPGIEGLAQRIFEMPTRIGLPNSIQGLPEPLKDPSCVSAVGLLLYGMQYKSTNTKEKRMGTIERENWFSKTGSKMRKWLVE
ncbi:MAG: cell division protein FtsA [bacterium]|nr:cell division protein FtsA [bacterium]